MPSLWNTLRSPISGGLLAIQSGSPTEILTLGGIIQRAEVIETFGDDNVVPTGAARFGEPLISEGATIWIEGSFPAGVDGFPVVQERADILAEWDALRLKLQSPSFHIYLHYQPGDESLFRRYSSAHTVLLQSHWADPIGFLYQLAAITEDRTLFDTEYTE